MNLGEFGVGLRNTILTLIVCLSLVVNWVLAVTTLAEPLGLYTVAVYMLVLYVLVLLLEHTQIRDADIRDALKSHGYPARLRTPMRVSFLPYVAVWLVWWFITQLFFDAGLVYENDYLAQLVLIPLVVAAVSLTTLYDLKPRDRDLLLRVLLAATVFVFFFPTFGWAPQHVSALGTALRVSFYFSSILAHDYVNPANVYANLSAQPVRAQRTLEQQLYGGEESDDPADLEGGQLTERRRTRVVSIIDAFERIDEETVRERDFVALSAWLLVAPLAVALLLFPLLVAAIFYAGRRQKQLAVDTTEQIKVHAPPTVTPPPPAVALPTPVSVPLVSMAPAAAVAPFVRLHAQNYDTNVSSLPGRITRMHRPVKPPESPPPPLPAPAPAPVAQTSPAPPVRASRQIVF